MFHASCVFFSTAHVIYLVMAVLQLQTENKIGGQNQKPSYTKLDVFIKNWFLYNAVPKCSLIWNIPIQLLTKDGLVLIGMDFSRPAKCQLIYPYQLCCQMSERTFIETSKQLL